MSPTTSAVATNIKMTPTSAADPYAALTPRPGIDAISPTHSTRLSTTAEPRPAVASANPASGPGTPEAVSNLNPSALLAALPAGNTSLTDLVLN